MTILQTDAQDPVLSDSALTQTGDRIVYEFSRAQTIEGWWIWAAITVAIGLAIGLCVFHYRRDCAELARPTRWTLIGLRLIVILSLVFIYFNLVRRTERRITRPSEVVVLIDTSQSMSLPVSGDSGADATSRIDAARELISQQDLLNRLGENHRTSLYLFDQSSEPKLIETIDEVGKTNADDEQDASLVKTTVKSPFAIFGLFCTALSLLAAFTSGVLGVRSSLGGGVQRSDGTPTRRDELIGWSLWVTAITMVLGVVSLGGVYSVRSEQSFAEIVGLRTDSESTALNQATDDSSMPLDAPVRAVDWDSAIIASGTQSRIGDAIRSILVDHEATTLAGIVVVTDGQNNGGSPVSVALAAARRSEVSLYPVGLGSSSPPTNVRIVDLEAPRRVYPGDKFAVSAVLQATGQSALEVDVELIDALEISGATDGSETMDSRTDPATAPTSIPGGTVIESRRVKLEPDATLTGIRFEIEPQTVGRRRLAVRVVAPPADQNRADDMQTARYEVVSRRLKVLAVAGGPTREYQFVRNLFFRDSSIDLHVWLQTGQPGMSQDADELLSAFPPSPEEVFDYDAMIFFDPDWSAFDSSSLDLIDQFLTQQAGGLVLIAGPVYHPRLGRDRGDARASQIGGFFPVNLATGSSLLVGGRTGGEDAWSLKFTDEARQAELLWIADSPEESFESWEQFDGVYDYVGVKTPKPGAKVYAYFSDPTTMISGSLPVFMASQFYGSGRVYFQGSGEMWRLRGINDALFDSYYTKLIRWVSEGRLLRDSKRGVLLVDTARAMIGQSITLRAVLVDDQFQPLSSPSVNAKLMTPDGKIKDLVLTLAADEPRGGTYSGNFVATTAGGYEIELSVGDALEEQVLRQSVQVRLPTSELERPRRADDELSQLASTTRGEYFPVDSSDRLGAVTKELSDSILPQPQVTLLPGTPDGTFNLRRNSVLIWLIASCLTLEWVIRRLHKLA